MDNSITLNRRQLMALASAVTVPAVSWAAPTTAPSWELAPLPFDVNALAPTLSSRTLELHHGVHHRAYADNLKKLVVGTELEAHSLERLVKLSAAGGPSMQALFNNAAQAWNHALQWQSLSPKGGGVPPAAVAQQLQKDFGSTEEFLKQFSAAALGVFGAGWAWLVWDVKASKLALATTSNAGTPLVTEHQQALATLDVWEHAYYVDFPGARKAYVTAVMDKLFNWRTVEERLAAARA